MGLRCPFCKADFGHEKAALEKHMKEEKEAPSIEALAVTNLADILKHVLTPEDKII